MPHRAPGPDDPRINWILRSVQNAKAVLDENIAAAQALPDENLSKAQRLSRYRAIRRQVDTVFTDLDKDVELWAERDVAALYRNGWFVGASQVPGARFEFTVPHREALSIISYDAYDDVATRLQKVRSGFGETIELQELFEGLSPEEVIAIQSRSRASVAQALLTGDADPKKVARQLAQDLWKDNPRLQIIDAGGRQWDMQTYTRMLVRTKSANAYNAGSLNKYAEEGVKRVHVFDGAEHDEECARANGQVWKLDKAMQNPIAHPNCRRAFAPKLNKGAVDDPTDSGFSYRLQQGVDILDGVKAIRHFYRTGEVNLSSSLARRVADDLKDAGGPDYLIDGLFNHLATDAFPHMDSLIESAIDPVLYNLGLIRAIPERSAAIAAARDPGSLMRMAQGWMVSAAEQTFGEDIPPKIGQYLGIIDQQVARVEPGIRYLNIMVNSPSYPKKIAATLRASETLARRLEFIEVAEGLREANLLFNSGTLFAKRIAYANRVGYTPETISELKDTLDATAAELHAGIRFAERLLETADADNPALIAILEALDLTGRRVDYGVRLVNALAIGGSDGYTPQNVQRILRNAAKFDEAMLPIEGTQELLTYSPGRTRIVLDQLGLTRARVTSALQTLNEITDNVVTVDDTVRWVNGTIFQRHEYGRFAGEAFIKLLENDVIDLYQAALSADRWVREGHDIKRSFDLMKELTIARAERVFYGARLIRNVLADVVQREAGVRLARAVDFTETELRALRDLGVNPNLVDESGEPLSIRALAEIAIEKQRTAERDIVALGGDVDRRKRSLNFPQSVGDSVPAPRTDYVTEETLDTFTDDLARRLGDVIDVPALNTAVLDDLKSTMFYFREDTPQTREIRRAMTRYMVGGTAGRPNAYVPDMPVYQFWVDVLGYQHPALVKLEANDFANPEDLRDVIIEVIARVQYRGGGESISMRLASGRSLFFADAPEMAERLAETIGKIHGAFWFEYGDDFIKAAQAEEAAQSPIARNLFLRHRTVAGQLASADPNSADSIGDFMVSLMRGLDEELRRFGVPEKQLTRSRMEVWLEGQFGAGNVSRMDGGIHGLIWRVVDGNGDAYIVKPIDAEDHINDKLSGIYSAALNTALSKILDADVVPYRVLTYNDSGDALFMAPFVRDSIVSHSIMDVALGTPDSTRRLQLFHILSGEQDINPRNFLRSRQTGQVHRIDHEMAFSLTHSETINNGNLRLGSNGTRSIPSTAISFRLKQAILRGEDTTFGTERPALVYSMTKAERDADVPGRLFAWLRTNPGPIIDDGQQTLSSARNKADLILGRYSVIPDAKFGDIWDPVVSVTDNELAFILRYLEDPDGVWDEIWQQAQPTVRYLQEDKVTTSWVSGSDEIYEVAKQFFDRRLRQAIDTGLIDISGNLSDTLNAHGTRIAIGDIVDLRLIGDDPLGNKPGELNGLVLSMWEDTLGRRRARVAHNLGIGLSEDALRTRRSPEIFVIQLDDYVDARQRLAVDLRSRVGYPLSQRRIAPWMTDVEPNPREVAIRVKDDYGIDLGFEYHGIVEDFRRERIWFVDDDGMPQALVSSTFASMVRETVESELAKMPVEYRPRRISYTLDLIDNGTGPRPGMFDEETGTLHISLLPLVRKLQSAEIESGYTQYGRVLAYRIEGEMSIDSIQSQIDILSFRRVLRHELGHPAHIGVENARRSKIRAQVLKQILDENPDAVSEDDLIGVAQGILEASMRKPDSGFPALPVELPEGTNALQYLLDLREDIIADVVNTNLVLQTQDIIDTPNDNIPSWVVAAFGAARRGEPDGHHEVFADIWAQISAKGGTNAAGRDVALQLRMDPDDLLRYLQPTAPDAPTNWDPASREFREWLGLVLDPRATRIIPERNTRARILWDQGDYLEELEFRTFDLPRDEGGGGFTYDIQLGKFVEPEGISVALKENERVFRGTLDEVRAQARAEIEEYVKEHYEILKQSEYKLGGWLEPMPDGTYQMALDTPRIFDDPIEAARFGFENDQKKGYDLNIFDEIEYKTKYETFDDWLDDYLAGLPPEEALAKRERIPSMVRTTGQKAGQQVYSDAAEGPLRQVPVSMKPFSDEQVSKLKRYIAERYDVQIFPESPWPEGAFPPPAEWETQWTQADAVRRIEAAEITRSRKVNPAKGDAAEAAVREAMDIMYQHGILVPADVRVVILTGTEMRKYGTGGAAPNAVAVGKKIYVNQSWTDLSSTLSRNQMESVLHEFSHVIWGESHPKVRALSLYGKSHPDEAAAEAFVAVLTGRGTPAIREIVEGSVTRFIREEPWFGEIMYRNAEATLEEGLRRLKGLADEAGVGVSEFIRERYKFYEPWFNGFVQQGEKYGVSPAKIMSAAALISPQRHADNNYVVAMILSDYVLGDKKFTAAELKTLREEMLRRAEQYTGFNKPEQAAMFRDAYERLRTGARPSDFSSEVLGFMLHPLIQEKVTGYVNYDGIPYVQERWGLIHGKIRYDSTGFRAIQVLRGELTVNAVMRGEKVRPFFNNILDPLDILGLRDVTIDYHMVNMFLRVLGSDASGIAVDSTGQIDGMNIGLKGFAADVLRQLFDDGWQERLGLDSDAQLQEILWGIWREGLDNGWWGDLPRIGKR